MRTILLPIHIVAGLISIIVAIIVIALQTPL